MRTPTLLLLILAVAAPAAAQGSSPGWSGVGKAAQRAEQSAAEVARDAQNVVPHRSGVNDYLVQTGKKYDVFSASFFKIADDGKRTWAADDKDKLYKDIMIAVAAYEFVKRKTVTYKDEQEFVSTDFWMNTGAAKFNPNSGQTQALKSTLNGHFSAGRVTQADLVYEAIVAAEGNVTLGLGSLAEIFCWNRGYIANVGDMGNGSAQKNYYRFAGAFIGLHGTIVRNMGKAGSWGNMSANAPVYAGAEIISWWKAVFTGAPRPNVNTAARFSTSGNNNIVDKSGQLNIGLEASDIIRDKHSPDI